MSDATWTASSRAGFGRFASWQEYAAGTPLLEWAQRRCRETEIAQIEFPGSLRIFCTHCQARVDAVVAWGPTSADEPNWRESTTCPQCGLIGRVRFCEELLRALLAEKREPVLYMTEQATIAYARVREIFPHAIGSEFVGDDPKKRERLQSYLTRLTQDGGMRLRHEDVTQLQLTDESQDAILTMEVLEHVPNYSLALLEFHRVLRDQGVLVISVPFIENSPETLLRARLTNDGIEHLMPPEYHGDPTEDAGCLAFHAFGWDLLDQIRRAGFRDAYLVDNWDPEKGYLGFVGTIYARK
ncbi:MAG TPA: methyltransferase domain-containing protein [Rhodanobacteraceae bacterium]|nr:methyltransferase domain-containing protein [Rhodanobacteraceae bacterium]